MVHFSPFQCWFFDFYKVGCVVSEWNLANQDPNISTNKARTEGFNPVNEKEVSMKPKDMPNEGFLPTNKRFQ